MTTISFSGIDGAGKSTQVIELQFWLRHCGLRSKLVTFWDDIAVLSRFRGFVSHHRVFQGDQGIGSPEKPLNRRDKNVTSWPVTAMRFCFYLADVLSLRLRVRAVRNRDTDVVIFDRFIYDELANLPLDHAWAKAFASVVLKIAPKPDIAYVIDSDPVAARARKPEYPLDFLRRNREAYLTLSRLAGDITVIEPGSIDIAQTSIRQKMVQKLSTTKAMAS